MNYTLFDLVLVGASSSLPIFSVFLGLMKDTDAGCGFKSEHSAPHLSLLMALHSLGPITSVLGHGLRSVSATVDGNSSKLCHSCLSFQ